MFFKYFDFGNHVSIKEQTIKLVRLLVVPLCLVFFSLGSAKAQSLAFQRARGMGMGINLSWLENYWNGTKANDFQDYLNLQSIAGKRTQLALMHQLGFKTVRLPVSFDHWTSRVAPYRIVKPEYFAAIDSILQWAKQYDMKVIIDNHHGSLDDSTRAMQELLRLEAIWEQVASRFKNTDCEKVFFELYNEPHDISDDTWKQCAIQLIKTVRKIAPHHTIIIGGAGWNSLSGLEKLGILPDDNVIYTFHFYDPFLFTHQGANWAGVKETSNTGIPFPYNETAMPKLNPASKDTWGERNYKAYSVAGTMNNLRKELQTAKAFSEKYKVPVFCGEWGSYKKYADAASRCRYTVTIKDLLNDLHIPFAYWEWDQGFSFFDGEPGIQNISECMRTVWGF